jgi:hypothetical protein
MSRESRLTAIMGRVITFVGMVLWINYVVYLPWPSWIVTPGSPDLGLIFYALATAGAGFVAWGRVVSRMTPQGLSREEILRASGLGFALLSGMRLETAVFPFPPFDRMMVLPLVEGLLFLVIAYLLRRKRLF